MTNTKNKSNFNIFRTQHEGSDLLLLPNAWDAGSARLIESLGARAIATTSAGMAWSAGYADGNQMPPDVVLSIAKNILRVIKVPLSVDIESGYSSNPAEVAAFVVKLAESGVAGINLEDGTEPADLLASKIEAVKDGLSKVGLDVFVNARTDVYLAGLVDQSKRVSEVLHRAKLYETAGANGLFVPTIADLPQVRRIVEGTKLPLNVMAWEGLASRDELQEAGVRRLSAGSGISQRIWAQTEDLAHLFLGTGQVIGISKPFGDLQKMFS